MATYNPTTNFTAKDALAAGDPNKIIRGADFGVEFDAISTAINEIPDSPFVNVKDYGALGDGVADDTAAIQSAINYASVNGIQTVLIPDGHYRYTTLRMYHEATDNPNFQESPNRDGKIRLLGHGRFSNNDLKNYDPATRGVYGTFLEGIAGGEGIIVDPTDAFDDQDSRNFVMEHMTVTANNTGYVIVNRQCPEFTLVNVAIKQVNYQGNGILNRNAWFTNIENCAIFGPSTSTNTPEEPDNNTGDGLVGETDFFAGEFNIHNSLIDSWANGFKWNAGQFVNVALRDTAVQNCNNYNIYGLAGTIFNLLLDNVYLENQSTQGVSFIKSVDDCFRVIKMTNCFMLAGNGGVARVSSHCIDLDNPDAIHIDNMYVFRPRQTFLNVTATRNLQNVSGEIKNSMFLTDEDLSAEPTVYLLDGILPNVHNCVWPTMSQGVHNTTGDIRLYDESVYGKYLRSFTDVTGTTAHSKFSYGDTEQVTVATSPYRMSGASIEQKAYYDLTHAISTGLAVYLPAPTSVKTDGRVIIVRNNENTTSASNYPFINVFVSTGVPPSTGFLVQLAPAEAAMFVFDGKGTNGGDFKCVGKWSDSGADYTVNADTGSETFQSGYESLRFTGGTAISTAVASPSFGEDEVTISLDTSSEVSFGAGIDVTGTVTADSATIDGAITVNGAGINLDDAYSLTWGDGSAQVRGSGASEAIDLRTASTTRLNIDADGDLSLYNSAGTSQDLFWDASESRLGLGTATPANRLTVSESSADFAALIQNSLTSGNGLKIQAGDNSGDRILQLDDKDGNEKLRVTALGSVGIGTSPTYKLDVYHAGFAAAQIASNSTSETQLRFATNTAARISNQSNTSLIFDTNAIERMRIDSSGNVGIGTTSPSSKLHVQDTNSIVYSEGTGGYGSFYAKGSGTNASYLFMGNAGGEKGRVQTEDDGTIVFSNTTSATERMRIDSSGRLLVGTDSVGYLGVDLTVGDTADSQNGIAVQTSTTGYGYVLFGDGTGTDAFRGQIYYKHGDDFMAMQTAGTERIRIDSSGNVGIGTTNAPYKLVVSNGGASSIEIEPAYSGTSNLVQHYNRAGAVYVDAVNIAAQHRFAVSGTEAMRIDSSGNVGIGTTTPSADLDVNGVFTVDVTEEDAIITGATPALEFVENDSGGSRMRMAWNTSGALAPTMYQSLYGDTVSTYGGINIQTRASDGGGNQVVYAYDPINDRNWWGTRTTGDVAMQLESDGTFNVRGGDVAFENSAKTSEDFYWDASTSRLGLGTTAPGYNLDVQSATDAEFRLRTTGTGSGDHTIARFQIDGTTASNYVYFGDADDVNSGMMRYIHSDDSMRTYVKDQEKVRLTQNQTLFYNGTTEIARFDTSNNFLVGTTATSPHTTTNGAEGGLRVSQGGMLALGRNSNPALNVNRITDDGILAMWYRNGTNVGNISVTSTATAYNTSSDERLKENIVDAPSATDIDALRVRSFDWKADGSHEKFGMIAQELLTVVPTAVTQGDTAEDMMGVDFSKLVPMLVKEVQELRARVAQLENV